MPHKFIFAIPALIAAAIFSVGAQHASAARVCTYSWTEPSTWCGTVNLTPPENRTAACDSAADVGKAFVTGPGNVYPQCHIGGMNDYTGGTLKVCKSTCVDVVPPSVSIAATPGSLAWYGGTVSLAWTVSNATACSASGDWSGDVSPTGGTDSIYIWPFSSDKAYTVTCTGAGGTAADTAVVTVGSSAGSCTDPDATNYKGALPCAYPPKPTPPPTVSLSADPTSLALYGGDTTLTWTAANANICSAGGDWSGTKAVAGGSESIYLFPFSGTHTFTITCSGSGGDAYDSESVTVGSAPGACDDPIADNYGDPLPCTYPSAPVAPTCADPAATNYGDALPCEYAPAGAGGGSGTGGGSGSGSGSGGTGSTICLDGRATNAGGPLPCAYKLVLNIGATADAAIAAAYRVKQDQAFAIVWDRSKVPTDYACRQAPVALSGGASGSSVPGAWQSWYPASADLVGSYSGTTDVTTPLGQYSFGLICSGSLPGQSDYAATVNLNVVRSTVNEI